MRIRETLHRASHALAGFLRGFLGLPGAPGTSAGAVSDAAAARRALGEHADRRRSCC
jgi:hypothetical protein